MLFAPLESWRHVEIRDRRTAIEYGHILRDLADLHCPDAEKLDLVQDNLNTHKPASLYEAFPPDKARRIVQRFEWHYTKGALSQKTAKLMVFTLIQAASINWLRLNGRNQLPKVIEGNKCNDGVEVIFDAQSRAA